MKGTHMEYKNHTYDEERALYGLRDAKIINCKFAGPADGESALKECVNIEVDNCGFHLRYPFWHVDKALIRNCEMTDDCRAALWYDRDVRIENTKLHGIKALRECDNTYLADCHIDSKEFAWKCRGVELANCELVSEYPFFECSDMKVEGLKMQGKYSFQYIENAEFKNCVLDTKDAFWHSRNVVVTDSVVKGEYLGWYAENLTFIRCKIIGTQPLCYVKNLVLEDCTMEGTDLAFEYSSVDAKILGDIDSVKNPLSGRIVAEHIGEIIRENSVKGEGTCEIIVSNK